MKRLLFTLLGVVIATQAYAASPYKIGFRTYSSPVTAPTTCTVWGQDRVIAKDDNAIPMQNFAPNPKYSRNLELGTKGFANYSTNTGVKAIYFTCRQIPTNGSRATPTMIKAKVFMNGVETYFLSLDTGYFVIGQ